MANSSEPNPSAGLLIRPPRDSEWPACRMLLPDTVADGPGRTYLLAVSDQPPNIRGALSYRRAAREVRGTRLRVVRTHRRQGIGSLLLGYVIAEARRWGFRAVMGPVDPRSEPEAEAFLLAHGFVRAARLTSVEGAVEEMRASLTALRDRLLARGKVPAAARMVRLREAPRDQVARLYAEFILHHPDLPAELIQQRLERGQLDDSTVLLVSDRVEGMILWLLDGSLARVLARVVTPSYQGGWANALLMATALEWGCAAGAARVRFESLDTNQDTLKLAQRFQAQVVEVKDRYVLRLGPADAAQPA